MKTTNIAIAAFLAALSWSGTPVLAGTALHHTKPFTLADEASGLLKDVEQQAYAMHDHALTIQSGLGGVSLSREFFLSELAALKDDVNAAGKEVAKLQSLSSFEDPQQQQTLEHATPILKDIARTVDAQIQFLNTEPERLDLPDYRGLTRTLSRETGNFYQLMHDSIALSNTSKRENHLQKELDRVETQTE